jgi:dipeptidyl aminopeptidase/acylaminoacyl peptidase
VLVSTRFGETSQLHRVAQPMGAREQITFYDEPVSDTEVQPGGATVAYGRDVGGDETFAGFIQNLETGAVTGFTAPGLRNQGFVWRPDGGAVAYTQVPATSANWDIMIADPRSGAAPVRVMGDSGALSVMDWSPDGARLLVQQYISIQESKLFLLDVAGGTVTQLAADTTQAYDSGQFLPDGSAVIVTSSEGTGFLGLVRIDLATGARTALTPDVRWNIETFDISPDGRWLVYALNEAGQSRIGLMDLRRGREAERISTRVNEALGPGVIGRMRFDDAGRRVGLTFNAATSPADAYSFDLRNGAVTRWTRSEVGGLDPAGFVAPSLIEWQSFDGLTISGFYYQPTTPGPHPVIVLIHGGPEAQSRPSFSSTVQFWVRELGVAVLVPNVRGSSGYGPEFLAADNGPLRENSVRDIGALLDWIAAQPELDENRVVVYGGSYGGYMVLASMVHYNDRLAGGVDIVGISNFITFLENTSGYRQDLRRAEYGDERDPEMRAIFEQISPLNSIHRVTRPLFVIHGANDPRVPLSEAEQVAAAVRANGGDVWVMVAADEGHGFRRRSNQEAQREAETLFLQRVLGLPPLE